MTSALTQVPGNAVNRRGGVDQHKYARDVRGCDQRNTKLQNLGGNAHFGDAARRDREHQAGGRQSGQPGKNDTQGRS